MHFSFFKQFRIVIAVCRRRFFFVKNLGMDENQISDSNLEGGVLVFQDKIDWSIIVCLLDIPQPWGLRWELLERQRCWWDEESSSFPHVHDLYICNKYRESIFSKLGKSFGWQIQIAGFDEFIWWINYPLGSEIIIWRIWNLMRTTEPFSP